MIKRYTSQDIKKQILRLLGSGMIEVELEEDDLEEAIQFTLSIYRQRAENAQNETAIIFGLQARTQKYDLSDRPDIINIHRVYRNGIGRTSTTGIELDPFMLQFTSQIVGYNSSVDGYGSLATIDFQRQNLKVMEMIFAQDIQFYFNRSTRQLMIQNYIARDEAILFLADCWRSDEELFNDPNIRPWIVSYSIAKSKQIIGEARGKFTSLVSGAGGVQLNGDVLRQEAATEIEALEMQLNNFVTSTKGYPLLIG